MDILLCHCLVVQLNLVTGRLCSTPPHFLELESSVKLWWHLRWETNRHAFPSLAILNMDAAYR